MSPEVTTGVGITYYVFIEKQEQAGECWLDLPPKEAGQDQGKFQLRGP